MESAEMERDGMAAADELLKGLLGKARTYCARAERCESEARTKLKQWGANGEQADSVVERLREERYIDDVRYAVAYCEDKLLHQRWSRQKTAYQLRGKGLPTAAVEQGMAAVDDDTYSDIMRHEAAKKMRELGGEETPEARRRLTSFLLGRGYTMDEVRHALGTMNDDE